MGIAGKNRHTGSILILVLAVLVCAWLIPAGAAFAASSKATGINVNVRDSIAMKMGASALSQQHGVRPLQVLTQLVTRTASSRLIQAGMDVGLPIGQDAGSAGDAARCGVFFGSLFGNDSGEIVITVTML